jgi:uncharacterized protein YlxP (DUF503 family)
MFVGVLRLTFHVPSARSLKDKRRVIRRFRDRVLARFDVSIAEVAAQDKLQSAVFGVSVVSSDASVCDSVLQQVARFAETEENAVLSDRATEIISLGGARDELYGGRDAS